MSLVRVPRLTTSPALMLCSSPGSKPLRPRRHVSPPFHVCTPTDHNISQEFYNVYGNSVSYTPVLNSGTQVIAYVEDSNGHEVWSDVVHIPPVLRHFS